MKPGSFAIVGRENVMARSGDLDRRVRAQQIEGENDRTGRADGDQERDASARRLAGMGATSAKKSVACSPRWVR